MTEFTPEQLKAIHFIPNEHKKHLIIEAGAGAGKTSVLSKRVEYLLHKASNTNRLHAHEILLLSFTKDAQKTLKERIDKDLSAIDLGYEYFANLHISTIDSLFDALVDSIFPIWWDNNKKTNNFYCPPQIRLISENEIMRSLEPKIFNYLAENAYRDEELALIIDFILAGGFKKSFNNFSLTDTLQSILKCMCQDYFLLAPQKEIELISQQIHPATKLLIDTIHKIARIEYEKRIYRGEFSYSDKIVFLRENLIHHNPVVVKELIVDEYQDTNLLQHEILLQLVNNSNGRMVVVGDPKQSIYRFRGACVNVFKSLVQNSQWQSICLNKNFRTHASLLEEINVLSSLAFNWQNPRELPEYKNSIFYRRAQENYIGAQALIPGIHESYTMPTVAIVTTSIPLKTKEKLKINNLSPLAYADFLLAFQREKQLNWRDIVVLCENNKQIGILHEAFSACGIPVENLGALNEKNFNNIANITALALCKCLAGKADRIDLYLVLSSPLTQVSAQELYYFFNQNQDFDHNYESLANADDYPQIAHFLQKIAEFKLYAHYNFFWAWQNLRWTLVKDLAENAKLFCTYLDSFAAALLLELSNQNIRIFLEDNIFIKEKSFILPDKIEDYIISPLINILDDRDTEDMLALKTVHKAKGMEWPCVCFYPKYGMQIQNSEFIAMLDDNKINISWLNQDIECLSIAQWIDNKREEVEILPKIKLIKFAQLQKQQEENYERQRVFYTAFTRAQKYLLLFQPILHHSAKKGYKEIATESTQALHSDYLEQDVYLRYIRENFSPAELRAENDTITAQNNNIQLTHYNLADMQDFNLSMGKIRQDITCSELDLHIGEIEFPITEQKKINLHNLNFAIASKKRERQSKHAGIMFHVDMEQGKINDSDIIAKLMNRASVCRQEFEIWHREEDKSSRNIIDMLLIIKSSIILDIFISSSMPDEIFDSLQQDENTILVVDFKTGMAAQQDYTQMLKYLRLMDLVKEKENMHGAILGLISYKTKDLVWVSPLSALSR